MKKMLWVMGTVGVGMATMGCGALETFSTVTSTIVDLGMIGLGIWGATQLPQLLGT